VADWQSFSIQVPGKEILEPVREVLETLLVYLEVLKTLLDTIKTFLIDFGNPIKALVQALLSLIVELLNSLKVSGFFGYFDVPDPLTDPNFDLSFGGFEAFTQRFKASLYDSADLNRPQPRTGSTQSGFVLLVVQAETVFGLLRLIKQLLRFFGKDFSSPKYAAPANFKLVHVGESGDPILAVASIFTTGIKAVQLSWTLPTNMETPDPGFTDLVTKVADEFVPPAFLIERSEIAPTRPLEVSSGDETDPVSLTDLHDPTTAGMPQYDRLTEFTVQGSPGKRLTVKDQLRDSQGEPIVKFQRYTVIDGLNVTNILGQLGTFRYIDTDVELGKTYYYRVHAYSGELDVVNSGTNTSYINWKAAVPPGRNPEQYAYTMEWPSKNSDPVIMGTATAILQVTVPKVIPDFDVIEVLRSLFKTAFSLDFQIPLSPDATFDDSGNPTGTTSPIQVGRSSLTNIASALAAFQSFPILGEVAALEAAGQSATTGNPITGASIQMPWEKVSVKRQSARLTQALASAMLSAGENVLSDFRNIMQGPFQAGVPSSEYLDPNSPPNLQNLVTYMTKVPVDTAGVKRYEDGYLDLTVRKNVLVAIQYLLNLTGVGMKVDWVAIVPLRDIIPWSGQMIYELLAAIQKLLDAFQGVMDEIKAFIDLLIRKIDAMERFIEFILQILNFIDSLQVGAYVLNASGIGGGLGDWVNIIDTAGNPPPKLPGGYSGGVGLAYVATDAAAFEAAFNIIF
jgi:hypothetical protein